MLESVTVMEAELARAHALVRGATGKDALELRAALERAHAALEAGATVQDALAELDEAPTARTDAQSTKVAGPSGGQTAAAEELVAVLESTFQPELFDPYCTPAALGPGGKQLHDRLAALCSSKCFERVALTTLCAMIVIQQLYLCGVDGPLMAPLLWTLWTLFVSAMTVGNQVSSIQILMRVCTSFDFLYSFALLILTLLTTMQWPTQSAFWAVNLVQVFLGPLTLDAYPVRRTVLVGFTASAVAWISIFLLAYFSYLQVEPVDFNVMGGRVNGRNRLLGAALFLVIVSVRFSVLAYRHPNRFVTITGVELCTVRREEAFTLVRVSERTKSDRTRHKVAAAPARPDAGSALEQVRSALRAAAAHSGPDSFGALRRELKLLCLECATDRAKRRTRNIAAELQPSASDSSTVAMLLPVFQATLVDENDSLGAALLHDRVIGPGSPVAVLVLCASWPLSFALTVAALLDAAPTEAALAITSLSALASALRLLQGSTMILRLLVGKFELWLAFTYAVFAAASGCVALADDPVLAALWCVSQTLLPIMLLYDSLPAASVVVGQAHRLAFFPSYLVFCAVCTGLLHTERFPGGGEVIRVFGVAQSPTQGCLSAHLLLFALALRYVYRSICRNGELVAVGGLRKTRLAMSDSRLLRATSFIARSNSRRYSFAASTSQSSVTSLAQTWPAATPAQGVLGEPSPAAKYGA